MNILITLYDPTDVEETLRFAAQFTHRNEQAPEILSICEDISRPSPAREILSHAHRMLNRPEIPTRLRMGDPLKEILKETTQGNFNLLILGEYHPPERGFLHRSDLVFEIIEHCPCPIVIVKGQARQVQRILMCDSGAEHSVLGRFVIQMAGLLRGEEEVTVLHVMSQISAGPGVRGKQLRADASELIKEGTPEGKLLQEDIQLLGQPGIHPIAKVRHGLVIDEILEEARQGDYDLVVIGAHHAQGWQRFLLEDLAKEIYHSMDRPLMVVK